MNEDHLTSISIENFRGFKSFRMEGLASVNLVAGANNTGKTALLEAIGWLGDSDASMPTGTQLRSDFRPTLNNKSYENLLDQPSSFIGWLFHQQNSGRPIVVRAVDGGGRERGVGLNREPSNGGSKPIDRLTFAGGVHGWHFWRSPESSTRRSRVTRIPAFQQSSHLDGLKLEAAGKKGHEKTIEKLIAAVDNRITAVRAYTDDGLLVPFVQMGASTELMPAVHLGQGVNRLIRIYSEMIGSGSQILLIDEIETGLHHSALSQLWSGIRELCAELEVQVFATTHSYECIRAAHGVFKGDAATDFAVHRLNRSRDGIDATAIDVAGLDVLIEQGFEIR